MSILVTGIRRVELETQLSNTQAAAAEFVERFGVLPTRVGDTDILGRCATCGVFIVDGDTHSTLNSQVRGPTFLDPDVMSSAMACERCMLVARAEMEDAAEAPKPAVVETVEDDSGEAGSAGGFQLL